MLIKTAVCQLLQWALVGSIKNGLCLHGTDESVSSVTCVVGARGLWGGAIRLAVGKIQTSCGRQPCGHELANTEV